MRDLFDVPHVINGVYTFFFDNILGHATTVISMDNDTRETNMLVFITNLYGDDESVKVEWHSQSPDIEVPGLEWFKEQYLMLRRREFNAY